MEILKKKSAVRVRWESEREVTVKTRGKQKRIKKNIGSRCMKDIHLENVALNQMQQRFREEKVPDTIVSFDTEGKKSHKYEWIR